MWRSIGRLQRRAAAAVRREPMIWSAALLFAMIAVVAALANGGAGPKSPPLSLSGQVERSRMLSAERQAATAQAIANQPQEAPTTSPTSQPAQPPAPPASTPALAPTSPVTAVWPLQGKIALGYGWVFDPTGGYWFYHTGWEIEAAAGSPVRAALPGNVYAVERESSGAYTVLVRSSDNIVTTYSGLGSTELAVGGSIGQGGAIGTLPSGKGSRSGRLGFSITRAGQPVNPASMLPSSTAGASPQG